MSKNFMNIQGLLAKCLATENILVEHSTNYDTASFDVENRVLRLPILKTDNEHLMTMFIGHETGHALITPQDFSIIPDDIPFDFVNVVEDVRIEKFIQNRYPGLRRDFHLGYKVLTEMDFFGINDIDTDTMKFIDRINIYYKLGPSSMIKFSDEEQPLVDMVDECETFDDVIRVSRLLSEFCDAKANNKLQDIEVPGNGKGQGQESDGQDSESPETNNQMDGDGQVKDSGDASPGNGPKPTDDKVSDTQRKMDNNMSDLFDTTEWSSDNVVYAQMPNVNLDTIISVDKVRADMVPGYNEIRQQRCDESFDKFLRDVKSDVNFMVQQFEMRKSADAYSRIQEHKTGVLNTNVLHEYKLNDDIFLRQTTTPDGKNHGMVMFIDWSGSMSETLVETVKQILVLVQFCRKVQIPFEVYTFTTGSIPSDDPNYVPQPRIKDQIILQNILCVQVLSSTAKRSHIEQDMKNLYQSAFANQYGYGGLTRSMWLSMGGTPLNSTLFMVPAVIDRFRSQTGAQKVSLVVMTDGASSPLSVWREVDCNGNDGMPILRSSNPHYTNICVRDGFKVTKLDWGANQTSNIVQWLKTKLGDVTITHFYIGGPAACQRYTRELTNTSRYNNPFDINVLRKNGSTAITTDDSWPLVVLTNPTSFSSAQSQIECPNAAGKAEIKKALGKFLKSKQSNKVVLVQLVETFA